jgi:hypothetical protein
MFRIKPLVLWQTNKKLWYEPISHELCWLHKDENLTTRVGEKLGEENFEST